MKQFRFFRNNTPRHAIVALAGLTLAAGSAAYAQIDTGAINGTVTDPSGAVVSDAQITERNVGTNATRTLKSAANGTYTISNLPAAIYEITVTAPGFSSYIQQVEVTVGGHATLDAKLTVGQGAEKVTVTGNQLHLVPLHRRHELYVLFEQCFFQWRGQSWIPEPVRPGPGQGRFGLRHP